MLRKKWEDYRASKFTSWFQFAYNFSTMQCREALWPFEEDAWATYVRNNALSLQRRGVFLETKLTAANGFNVAFPFLDPKGIELLNGIPAKLRGELLYDKDILRKAFKDLLPASFHGQPKFYRTQNAETKIYGYLKPVLYDNSYSLLKLAYDASPGLQERFSIDKLIAFLDQAQTSASFPTYVYILELINIGLLEAHLIEREDFDVPQTNDNKILYRSNNQTFNREALSTRILGDASVEV